MKKLIIFLFVSILSIQFVNSQINMNSDGNLKFCEKSDGNGIKIWRDNPSDYVVRIKGQWDHNLIIGEPSNRCYDIYVTNLKYYNLVNLSDKRLKKNIIPLNGILDSILQLEPVKFDYIPFQSDKMTKEENERNLKDSQNRYGFIAQDVKKIFPHLVSEGEDGMYAINMSGLIALCVESIKEQQNQINQQKELIYKLTEKIETIENDCCNNNEELKSASLDDANTNITNEALLFQNTPNPFSVSTTIRYSLPKNINNATITIYNMNGTQLKSVELHQTGESSIEINGGEFNAGMCLYSLIADRQIIDTKRMILTD